MDEDLEFATILTRHQESSNGGETKDIFENEAVTKTDRKQSFKAEWIVLNAVVLLLACSIISILVIAVFLTETIANNKSLEQKYIDLDSRLTEYIKATGKNEHWSVESRGKKDEYDTTKDGGNRNTKGQKGEPGVRGSRGIAGPKGELGNFGFPGINGLKGDPGPKGEPGVKGIKGGRGIIGFNGKKGNKGDYGIKGSVGNQGVKGDTGPRGPKGSSGIKGEKGDHGEKGGFITCDAGWTDFRRSCYYFEFRAKKNFQRAQVYCTSHGAYLTKIDDIVENWFLRSILKEKNPGNVYFGLHDNEREGTFKWVSDNSTVTFSDWGPYQPDNGGNREEDCGHFWFGRDYKWNDVQCSNEFHFICEKNF